MNKTPFPQFVPMVTDIGDPEEWILTGFAFVLPGAFLGILSGVHGVVPFLLGLLGGIFLTVGYFRAKEVYR